MKMYILVRDDIAVNWAMVALSHAALVAYLKWQDDEDMQEWLKSSFRKVTCKVTPEQFEEAKSIKDSVVITESALDGKELAVVIKPRKKLPKSLKSYILYT
jgi:peptidyl-tRNA hydrolase